MLYKFKSKSAGDVIMLEANGRRILELMGKDAGPTGIIEPQEMPAAIQALEAAVAREEAARAESGEPPSDGPELRQRVSPFIEMLRHNLKAGTQVVWGV